MMKHRCQSNVFRPFVCIAVLLALCTGCFAGDRAPNIILINADDLGYGDLGCYGATKVQTPNIDKLAKQGRRFTDAHSPSAVCSPISLWPYHRAISASPKSVGTS